MITWHKCSRRNQSNSFAAAGYYEKIENGKPTGIIVENFLSYPDCEIFDWSHIEKITSKNKSISEFSKKEKNETLDNEKIMKDTNFVSTLETDDFKIMTQDGSILISPVKKEPIIKEIKEESKDFIPIYKVEYEWNGDDETEYWTMNKLDAKAFVPNLQKKYSAHKIILKDIIEFKSFDSNSIKK